MILDILGHSENNPKENNEESLNKERDRNMRTTTYCLIFSGVEKTRPGLFQ